MMRRSLLVAAVVTVLGVATAETTIPWSFDASGRSVPEPVSVSATLSEVVANWAEAYVNGLLPLPGILMIVR